MSLLRRCHYVVVIVYTTRGVDSKLCGVRRAGQRFPDGATTGPVGKRRQHAARAHIGGTRILRLPPRTTAGRESRATAKIYRIGGVRSLFSLYTPRRVRSVSLDVRRDRTPVRTARLRTPFPESTRARAARRVRDEISTGGLNAYTPRGHVLSGNGVRYRASALFDPFRGGNGAVVRTPSSAGPYGAV